MAIISQYRQEMQAQAARLIAGSRLFDTPYGLAEVGQVGAGPTVILSHGSLGTHQHAACHAPGRVDE